MSENVYCTEDIIFKETQIRNNNVVVLPGDKDSCVIIMNRLDYTKKVESMLQKGILKGKYVKTEGNILKEVKSFQSFIYRHFKTTKVYNDMMPSFRQPARFLQKRKNSQV